MKKLGLTFLSLFASVALTAGAQAQTFTETFDGADGVAGPATGLTGNFTTVSMTGGNIGNTKGDGWASLVDDSVMNMTFSLASAPTQISVDFWASVFATAAPHQSAPVVTLTGANGATQTITGATQVQSGVANPGTNGANASEGSNYVFTFANPMVAPWSTGLYTLTFDNAPAKAAIRIDDIAVTAVPEPHTLALMLSGLAAVGFVVRRRSRA